MDIIKRKRQKPGDILELKIENFGYIYFKIIDILKFKPESSYPFLIRIYKKIYIKPIIKIEDLERDLLIHPISISGYNGLMKALPLRILYNEEEILDEEKILPDMKDGSPIHAFGYNAEKYEQWKVYKELGDTKKTYYTSNYEKIKHLEWVGGMNITCIPFRIKLELLKLEGKDIKEEYGLNDWLEELIYKMAFNLPIYSQLDPETRDYAYR